MENRDVLPTRIRARAKLELERRRLAEKLAGYRGQPAKYVRDILHVLPTPDQEEIVESVDKNRRTAVKASHGVGKTFSAAMAANYWYDCWDQHIVYVTAPTWNKALGLTFKQIKLMRRQAGLPGEILENGLIRDPDKIAAAGHFIQAINAETGEGFQGEHTSPILVVMEEAVGVPAYIHTAADVGLMTSPECRILQIANPTVEASAFGEACRSRLYKVFTISALDHINIRCELACERAPYPNAVRLVWLYEQLIQNCEVVGRPDGDTFEFWTIDAIAGVLAGRPITRSSPRCIYFPNAEFQGRALGVFPTQELEQVIPRGWIEALGVLPLPERVLPQIGADMARHGDDRTVIATRWGPKLRRVDVLRQMGQATVLGALRLAINGAAEMARCNPRVVKTRIDVTGGLGTGPADILLEEGYDVEAVNSSESAMDEEFYVNRRSELWWTVRELVRRREIDISEVGRELADILIREWSTPKWRPDHRGRRVVETKAELKKPDRLGRSPDVADAVNLAFAVGPRGDSGEVACGPPRQVQTLQQVIVQAAYDPEALGGDFAVGGPAIRPAFGTPSRPW